MIKMKYVSLLLCIFCISCNATRYNKFSGESITQSLFNDKDRTISEADIQRLLDGHFTLPDTLRVAVYKLGAANAAYSYRYYGYADEVGVKAQQLYMDTLATILKNAPFPTESGFRSSTVKRVNLVPSLMLSAQPNITQLREAAVRLQCDILLVFSATSDIYNKYRAFKKDETKAYATTEAFVMDIRTGLIPFSTLITKDFLTKKLSSEEYEETRRRAQSEAVLKTLAELGERVNAFLRKQ